jgi:hypothetical protein
MRTFVVIVLSVACAASVIAQQLSSQTKAREIAATFTKNKHAVKEKFGVRVEKYKDVRSEPAVKSNISDYSGVYEAPDLDYRIRVQVGSDGRIQASGSEKSRAFTLENARIDGALLTATKVYSDGAREKFEGSFLNRTDRNSPTDPRVTIFGLGVVLTTPFEINGLTYDKVFYQLK